MKSYLIGVALISGCSLNPKSKIENLDLRKFDTISVGESLDKVVSVVGKPDKVLAADGKEDHDENWIYKDRDEEGFQVAAVSLDSTTHQVTGVLVIPREDENESKLDFLKENKFSDLKFEEYALKRCHRDFFPRQIYYINKDKGVIIIFEKVHKYVESFARTTPNEAQDVAAQIVNCKR